MLTVASTELSDVRVTVAVKPSVLVIPNVIVTVGSAAVSPATAAAAGAGKEKTISPEKNRKYETEDVRERNLGINKNELIDKQVGR